MFRMKEEETIFYKLVHKYKSSFYDGHLPIGICTQSKRNNTYTSKHKIMSKLYAP